jgi:hypothetical protein
MSLGAQNMKTRHDALSTAENESGRAKLENGTRRPWYRRKMSPGAQNMKTGHDAQSTAKMSLIAQNLKTGPGALGTAENESGRAKHENGT